MTDSADISISPYPEWQERAQKNVEEWGLQDRETLLLAMQEELGELVQAHLEAKHEDGSEWRIVEEMDDLGALMLQLATRVERGDD